MIEELCASITFGNTLRNLHRFIICDYIIYAFIMMIVDFLAQKKSFLLYENILRNVEKISNTLRS